ncbi:MAG: pyrrolo-quinoline quinone [Candidatus Pelethousia sp.]|nr:pyrrolo-quinoline quinone [Candidatus Pelethousia sp.]
MGSQTGKKRRRRRKVRIHYGRVFLLLALLIAVIAMAVLLVKSCASDKAGGEGEEADKPGFISSLFNKETPAPVPTQTPEPTPTPIPAFSPEAISGTKPGDFGLEEAIEAGGAQTASYTRAEPIDFYEGYKYTELPGVIGFRGNNFRDSAAYGTVNFTGAASEPWTFSVGSLSKMYGEGSWTGCGWTGQPLIVKWPQETKRIMNLYEAAKNDPDLVEVIYATMDGHIYFLNLHTGEKTRDAINIGYPFKGAGALDPRGYPLMYVGSGDDSPTGGKGSSRAFIISLIDGKTLYEFGAGDNFSLRGLSYFDSSALVDAETDTLIYPGESGILYTIKLNTQYDQNAGTISIAPETVKWRYKGTRSNSKATKDGSEGWWLGVEDSAIIWRGHAIFTDNGGHMICLDLNTLKAVWVQDTLDDTNCTPVLSLEGPDQHPYVYTSTSFHPGWRAGANSTALIPIWKIDAVTGQIVAKNEDYHCQTIAEPSQVSGGVQGTLALGKNDLEGLVFVPIAMTEGMKGKLVAFNTADMSVKWQCDFAGYPWSSPVAVYDANGKGYLIQCNKSGYIHLIDGQTGTIINEMSLGSNIEASPAVYNNMVVVGTRGGLIYGVDLNYLKNYVKPAA